MCRDGWRPMSTTKFGWSVNINSMQVEEFGQMWVRSEISCSRPELVVSKSICKPSFYLTKDDLNSWIWYRSFSKFSKKYQIH